LSYAAASELENNDPSGSVAVVNGQGASRLLLVCEHASHRIPARYAGLGMAEADKLSHAAWDPGAQALAERLSTGFDARLVLSTVSRLVYDCNRPPDAPGAMRPISEKIVVPGNENLTDADKAERIATIYEPFKQTLAQTIKSFETPPVLVTVHSFTRIFNNIKRDVDVGIIHDEDDRLAVTMIKNSTGKTDLKLALNAPYSRADGVAHTLALHGTDNGLVNVMIEVCNDLLETPEQQAGIADMLIELLSDSLVEIGENVTVKGTTC